MSKSYSTLKAIIMAKLTALKGADNNDLFGGVYGVRETESAGYPACYVIENTGGGQILDTHRNQREWQFSVIIDVKIGKTRTPEAAYAALLDAVDRTVKIFDEDPLLLNSNQLAQCQWVRVVPVEFRFGIMDTAYHQAELTVAIIDVVNRYPAS